MSDRRVRQWDIDDPFRGLRAELLGDHKPSEPHSAPWFIRHGRTGPSMRDRCFVVYDNADRYVAEFEDEWTARQVVDLWNARRS